MKDWIKKLIVGSILETPLRYLLAAVKGRGSRMGFVYDLQTVQVLKKVLAKNDTCIDVGCHRGEILKHMIKCAPLGKHFAFEPIPSFFEQLKIDFGRMENVHVYNCALGDDKGEVEFHHVTTNPAYSGLKQRRLDREGEVVEKIRVKLERLDDVLPSDALPKLIKIDVEGAELSVIEGGVNTIVRAKPYIIFECGKGATDVYGHTPAHIFDVIANRCGLEVSTMKRWLDGKPSFTREAFVLQFEQTINFYFLAYPAQR